MALPIFERNDMKKFIIILTCICLYLATSLQFAQAIPRSSDEDVRTVNMTSTLAGTTDQMFTVTGGRIEIISLFGECTVAAGTPGNTLIQLDATDSSDHDRAFSTIVDIGALGVGDVVRFSSAMDIGVLDITANRGAGQPLSWFCSPGEIELNTSSGTTGAIVWYMSYRRLETNSRVTAN